MKTINVTVKDHVRAPIDQVYDAIINPNKLTGYFVSEPPESLAAGKTITWNFDDAGVIVDVEVLELKHNKLIRFNWAAGGLVATVKILLTPIDAYSTSVDITESSFPFDESGVSRALQQTQGWTDFICSMKAYLYTGINLRNGRTTDAYKCH